MNLEKLLHDYNVPSAPPGDANYREGWINVTCPFCADHSFHLGLNESSGYANCWRCGWHPTDKVVAKLTGVTLSKARILMREYKGFVRKAKEVKRKVRAKAHKLPSDTEALKSRHKKYLASRGFDPDYIEHEWGVLGTGPLSKLDKVSYKHRILAPIYWDGERVSFQARDITGKHKLKYMACPEERELIKHKHVLYGKQSGWADTGIIVEGITDVWRLGTKAAGTFGIDFTSKQVRMIAKHFSRVIIIYDDEPQAQRQAATLQAELAFRGVEAVIETIQGDPGSLTQKQANTLVRRIF